MGSIFYNPEVFAWGDAIGEGMGAYLMGKDIQLKDLQRKKLYEDLAKEAEVKKGLTGITEKEAAGLYAPTVSTTRGRQLTQESPTYDPMGLSSGAVALPTETVQQTTTVPPQRSMYDDLSKMYMRTGNIKEALQAVQLQEFEKKLNSEEGRSALDMVVKLQTAFKGKPIPKELNDIFSSTYPSFKGIDLTKIKPETPDFSFMSYPINVKNTAIIVTDKNAGTSTVKIVDTTEKASTILDIIKVANPIAEGETKADWNARILKLYGELKQGEKTLTKEQEAQKMRISAASKEKETTSVDLKRLSDIVAIATAEGQEPSASDIVVIQEMADKAGYEFKKLTGKSAEYGLPFIDKSLWGGKETSQWQLVPKKEKTVKIDGKQYKDGDIVIQNGKKFRVKVK